jgi:hypothetical protein
MLFADVDRLEVALEVALQKTLHLCLSKQKSLIRLLFYQIQMVSVAAEVYAWIIGNCYWLMQVKMVD